MERIRVKWLGHDGWLLAAMPPLDVLLALDSGRLVVAAVTDVTIGQPIEPTPYAVLECRTETAADQWMRNACAWIEEAFGWALDNAVLHRCPDVFMGARALVERCPAEPTDAERKDWRAEAERLREERDEARREAEIERDRICHPDHGGHVFPWERGGKEGGAE